MASLTQHIITVDSGNRNGAAYPNTGQYQVDLPQRYRNIWSAQLLNISLPEPSDSALKNLFLCVDKISTIDSTASGAGVNFALAKLPLSVSVGNVYFLDSMTSSFMSIPLQNPVATLDKLNVSFRYSNGNVATLSNNHSYQIMLNCGDYIQNGGGSTIAGTKRVLGGTR
jgi:hypothetical protein